MPRILNFSSGPAMLPLPVLETAQAEILDYAGCGMSMMEMSHRCRVFDGVIQAAEANLRALMRIPDDYAVLFLPGGASQQFAMIPLNLLPAGGRAEFIDSGSWGGKAVAEARITAGGRGGRAEVVWSGKDRGYMAMPLPGEVTFSPGSAYSYLCSNETIAGVQFKVFPESPAPLVADMSSDILSREIDVKKFGLIFAGAQKNLGPAGLAVVIIRRDLAGRCPEDVNLFFRYATHMKEPSLYNTPNTWAIYIFKLVTDWLAAAGGVAAIARKNGEKAAVLYNELDRSAFWKPCVEKPFRSTMNVTWRLKDEALETAFAKEATAVGLDGLKGHRSVGGLRASIYNAFPREGIDTLVQFMRDFERRQG